MVDGQVFRANSFLQPGWQLQMPDTGEAAGCLRTQLGAGAAPVGDEKSEHTVTVQSGDYLSKIAEEELGDGNAWPRLFEASRGKPQPDGLPAITDPDLIRPGQQVTVPGTQPGKPPQDRESGGQSGNTETTPPVGQKPDSEQNPDEGPGDQQAPEPSHTATPAPEAPAPSASASRTAERPDQDQAAAASGPTASASASRPRPGQLAPLPRVPAPRRPRHRRRLRPAAR
ncbi:hypothetical protein AB0C98_09965 [Streptomyces sp. NPDC048558]|uniref:LysM peptidoglycan-binding domain-containing protein n=1 Tax=Streptomyces sp. NPDC048558 TaxID=3155759 RepID=UPI0033FE1244